MQALSLMVLVPLLLSLGIAMLVIVALVLAIRCMLKYLNG